MTTVSQDGLPEAERLLNQSRALSQRAAAFSKRLAAETESLAEEVGRLDDAVDKALAGAAASTSAEWVKAVVHLESAKGVLHGNGPGGDLRKYLRTKKPALLGFFLGASVNVLSLRRDEAIRIKEEYHTFRNRSAYTMFTFAAVLYALILRARRMGEAKAALTLTPVVMALTQLFLCWLLFFYVVAALRESVLKINGSHIRPWWIHHHYWSMATAVLMLSLPVDSPSVVHAVPLFLWWAMMQAVVIVLQNRYQRRRMYTRIALGKNSAMDVVSGETSGAHGQLLLLYPMLLGMQMLQAYIGIEMMTKTYWALLSTEGFLDPERKDSDLWGGRGVALAGGMMLFMAVRNFANTVATIMEKKGSLQRVATRITALRSQAVTPVALSPQPLPVALGPAGDAPDGTGPSGAGKTD